MKLRRRHFVLLAVALLIGAVGGTYYWYRSRLTTEEQFLVGVWAQSQGAERLQFLPNRELKITAQAPPGWTLLWRVDERGLVLQGQQQIDFSNVSMLIDSTRKRFSTEAHAQFTDFQRVDENTIMVNGKTFQRDHDATWAVP
jgi:hypothetical protein